MWKLIKEDINCVFDRDPAARNVFDVLTCYSGVHALLFHRINHWLWLKGMRWSARFLGNIARWLTGIEIHPGAVVGRRFFVDHGTGVVIGETAQIGNDVTLYQGVTLGGRTLGSGKRHPTLGNSVVVGAGAKILGPFTVADDARIGSNAVVLEAVPAGATVVGVPGRIVKCQNADEKCLELVRENREALRKPAFDAYGVSGTTSDPIEAAIAELQQQVEILQVEVERLRTNTLDNSHGNAHDNALDNAQGKLQINSETRTASGNS